MSQSQGLDDGPEVWHVFGQGTPSAYTVPANVPPEKFDFAKVI